MIFLALIALLGSPDPMDVHAGDFLDLSPGESLLLAAEAYRNGDWYQAAAEYLNALEIDPSSSNSIYNLACCYGLMGEGELAAVYLRRAYSAGFTDLEHINWDPDFDSVRELSVFSTLLDSLNTAAAEQDRRLGELHWFDAVESFYYRVRFPEGFNPPVELPLVIGLHGFGGSPDSFIKIWELIDEPDFIFVVPQAPYPIGEDAFSWYRGENGSEEWGHSLLLAGNYMLKLTEHLQNEYPVSEIYLFGFSQGACLSLYTGIRNPELFNTVIAASGWLEEDFISADKLNNPTDMRIELIHSPEDRGVPFTDAQRAVSVLSIAGWNTTLHNVSGGHMIDMEAVNLILINLDLAGNN